VKRDPLRVRDGYWWVEARFVSALGKKVRVQKTTGVSVDEPDAKASALLEHGRIMAEAYARHGRLASVGATALAKTIADAFARNRARKIVADRAENTLRILDQAIPYVTAYFGADRPASTLTTELYVDYIAHRKKSGDANATIRRELRELNQGIKALGLPVPEIPDLGQMGERTRTLPVDETRRLLERLRVDWNQDVVDAFTVYRTSGVRAGELFLIDDVRLSSGMMHVDGTKTGGSKRWMPMSVDTRAVLERRLAGKASTAYPFSCGSTEHAQVRDAYNALAYRFQKSAERLGLVHFSLNDIRRSFATELLIAGESIKKVSALLGHKDTRMVDKYYARLFGRMDELAGAVKLLASYGDGTPTGPEGVNT
jgi:integrase